MVRGAVSAALLAGLLLLAAAAPRGVLALNAAGFEVAVRWATQGR